MRLPRGEAAGGLGRSYEVMLSAIRNSWVLLAAAVLLFSPLSVVMAEERDSLLQGRALPFDLSSPSDAPGGVGFFCDVGGTILNAEYFHPLALGYTIPGAQAAAGALYNVRSLAQVRVGWHLRMLGGKGAGLQHCPVISVSVEPVRRLCITLGSLPHPFSHRLPNHLYLKGREWIESPEFGANISYSSSLLRSELWVDWEDFIWINSPIQERFFLGFQSYVYPLRRPTVSLGLIAFAHHTGGQIDTANLPVQTLSNLAFNVEYVTPSWASGRGGAGFSLWGLFSSNSRLPALSFLPKHGWGIVSSGYCTFSGARLEVEYFYGRAFMPLRGHPLYSSRTMWLADGECFASRSMLTASLGYRIQWFRSVSLEAMGDAHYDFSLRRVDYSFELSVRVALASVVWSCRKE